MNHTLRAPASVRAAAWIGTAWYGLTGVALVAFPFLVIAPAVLAPDDFFPSSASDDSRGWAELFTWALGLVVLWGFGRMVPAVLCLVAGCGRSWARTWLLVLSIVFVLLPAAGALALTLFGLAGSLGSLGSAPAGTGLSEQLSLVPALGFAVLDALPVALLFGPGSRDWFRKGPPPAAAWDTPDPWGRPNNMGAAPHPAWPAPHPAWPSPVRPDRADVAHRVGILACCLAAACLLSATMMVVTGQETDSAVLAPRDVVCLSAGTVALVVVDAGLVLLHLRARRQAVGVSAWLLCLALVPVVLVLVGLVGGVGVALVLGALSLPLALELVCLPLARRSVG